MDDKSNDHLYYPRIRFMDLIRSAGLNWHSLPYLGCLGCIGLTLGCEFHLPQARVRSNLPAVFQRRSENSLCANSILKIPPFKMHSSVLPYAEVNNKQGRCAPPPPQVKNTPIVTCLWLKAWGWLTAELREGQSAALLGGTPPLLPVAMLQGPKQAKQCQ